MSSPTCPFLSNQYTGTRALISCCSYQRSTPSSPRCRGIGRQCLCSGIVEPMGSSLEERWSSLHPQILDHVHGTNTDYHRYQVMPNVYRAVLRSLRNHHLLHRRHHHRSYLRFSWRIHQLHQPTCMQSCWLQWNLWLLIPSIQRIACCHRNDP